MPFAGISVNTNWAAANKATVQKVIDVYNKSIAWLYDPNNRDEAVQILMKVSKIKKDDVEQAYDFLIKGKYFEPTGKVSRSKLTRLVDALKSLGDIPQEFSGRPAVPARRDADRRLTCSSACARTISPASCRSWAGSCSGSSSAALLVANPLFLAAPSQII